MLQRFSIGLRLGEDGGHTMTFSPFIPIAAIDAEVFFAWDGKKVVSHKLHILCRGH
ncbi:unnamed protein product, partial [Staurois parvus]